ncbi:hypothetical protein [Ruegeria sp. HKCCSP351]|uniref:hypothetical protein n=1 Tax=Ruegeria sp. HKCCSP351 TaxID=2794832 RepID=UPI001AE75040|nr:hypothetical protein [Ruegeria sp. HKCCSP351]
MRTTNAMRDEFMYKKTLFMHIGAPKTGTSAFQTYCAEHSDILFEKHGLLYPDLSNNFHIAASGGITSGNGLLIASVFLRENKNTIDASEEGLRQLDAAMSLLRGDECRKLLISSEDLFHLSPEDFLALSEKCRQVDTRLHLICAVRDLLPWLASIYGQQVKQHGRTDDFERCAPNLPIKLSNIAAISKAAKETDAFTLTVLNYADIRQNVAQGLLKPMNINHFDALPQTDLASVNRSLDTCELALMRSANAALKLRPPNEGAAISEALIVSDPARKGANLQLPEGAANQVWQKHKDSVDYINQFISGAPIGLGRNTNLQKPKAEVEEFFQDLIERQTIVLLGAMKIEVRKQIDDFSRLQNSMQRSALDSIEARLSSVAAGLQIQASGTQSARESVQQNRPPSKLANRLIRLEVVILGCLAALPFFSNRQRQKILKSHEKRKDYLEVR